MVKTTKIKDHESCESARMGVVGLLTADYDGERPRITRIYTNRCGRDKNEKIREDSVDSWFIKSIDSLLEVVEYRFFVHLCFDIISISYK